MLQLNLDKELKTEYNNHEKKNLKKEDPNIKNNSINIKKNKRNSHKIGKRNRCPESIDSCIVYNKTI